MGNFSYFLGRVRMLWACLSISTVTRCAALAVVELPTLCLFVLSLAFAADHVTALEYPYVMALLQSLQDQTTVVHNHNVESREVVRTVPAPPLPSPHQVRLRSWLCSERSAGHWL